MTGEGWRLRRGTAEDIGAVLELERGIGEAPHWGEREYVAATSLGGGAVRRRMFVVEADGRLLGFAVASVQGTAGERWGELESVATAAGARRMGVGEALCRAVLGWCREEGAGRVELEVRAGGLAARALYGKLGFERIGERRGYYKEPAEDAVLMTALGLGSIRTDLGKRGKGSITSARSRAEAEVGSGIRTL